MPRHFGVFAFSRKARYASVDEAWVEGEAFFWAEIERFEDAGTVGVDEDVDFVGKEERVEEICAGGRFEVEGERGFVAGEEVVVFAGGS